jgi:acyl transferase domain-containing protein
MNVKKVGLLFPGQGACYPGVLKGAGESYPEVREVFGEIDAVARERFTRTVSGAIWNGRARTLEELVAQDPEILQLAIFGTSVALYRLLEAEGLQPDVLLGHSFGEIAAMVAGGAFSVRDGAHIVCDRTEACRLVSADGYMAALGASQSSASNLVELLGNHDMVVAGENSDTQTVLSGVRAKMDRAAEIARILNVGFFRLNSPHPFHSPLMEPVRAEFGGRLRRYTARPLNVPVFSPIMGRYYEANDSLTDCLASHLVRPVAFAQAVRALHQEGVRVLVECGALDALTKLATKAVQSPDVTAIVCLGREGDDTASLGRAIDALRVLARVRPARRSPVASVPAPAELSPADADSFWAECGPGIRDFVDRSYERFREQRQSAIAPVGALASGASSGTANGAAVTTTAAPPPASSPAVVPPQSQGTLPSRDVLFRELVSVYAAALEYPEEVFTDAVQLEAELGIDSVKQTELLARVAESYRLPPRPPEFRLADYDTMGRVVDFVLSALSEAPSETPSETLSAGRTPAETTASAAAVETPAAAAPVARPAGISRADVFRDLAAMYASALEYPVEVFTEKVELEAELGIDSVKQTELLARAAERYQLPPRPADFRLADYGTMDRLVDFIHQTLCAGPDAAEADGVAVPVLQMAAAAGQSARASRNR